MLFTLVFLAVLTSSYTTCPSRADPSRAKLLVFEDPGGKGRKATFLTPIRYIGGSLKGSISSVYAMKGDWEIFGGINFVVPRIVIKEGQKINLVKMNDRVSSVRPLCEEEKVEGE